MGLARTLVAPLGKAMEHLAEHLYGNLGLKKPSITRFQLAMCKTFRP